MFNDDSFGVIVCSHVFDKQRDILYVCHESEGWQFLCGEYDHDGPQGTVVGIGHLTVRDPSLHDVSDLETNWEAERSSMNEGWIRGAIKE
jgi:hypothetical protein